MNKKFMKRAITLAKKGLGYTNPNPMVGAVIVKDNRIIAEGYHKVYGQSHAEVNAFKNAQESVKGATMYVTLEPCAHYGNTPPCALAIIEHKIKHVVIGLVDPNPLVNHKGIQLLKEAGIKVTTGVFEEEIRKLNKFFLYYMKHQRPYCILKTAMTLDGKIASVTGDSKWITNEKSRLIGHHLRHQVAGIVVGINTIIEDNPRLTTRLKDKPGKDPHRIILDSNLRIPLSAQVLSLTSTSKTIIATTVNENHKKIKALKSMGIDIIRTTKVNDHVNLEELMAILGERKIDSLLIEGGGTINYSFLKSGYVQEIYAFIAPKIIGGRTALTPIAGEGIQKMQDAIYLKDTEYQQIENDLLIKGLIE